MSGKSWLVIIGLAALIGVLYVMPGSAGAEDGVEALQKKIEELEKKITSLEKQMQSLRVQVAQGGGGGANQALEQEAAKAYGEINTLVAGGNVDDAKKKLTEFQQKYGRTRLASRATRLSQELSVFGKDKPADWGIERWFQGENDVSLDADATTLLVFWETWCPHCQREVPKMQKIWDDYRGKGLQVVGLTKINRGATPEKVETFINQNKMTYPVAKEDGRASTHFAVRGVPAAAVLKKGKVVWRGHPATLSNEMLEGWL